MDDLPALAADPVQPTPGFSIAHQKVELDFNFCAQLKGRTEITIYPDSKELRTIRLDARQIRLERVTLNFTPCAWKHDDPYDRLAIHGDGGAHQHHILGGKIANTTQVPPVKELIIEIPKQIKIKEADLAEVHTQGAGTIQLSKDGLGSLATAQSTQALADTSISKFTILTLVIEYTSKNVRDGLQFARGRPGSGRWPHVYTHTKYGPGAASCLFPCLDSLNNRSDWDISIRCPKTVADAASQSVAQTDSIVGEVNGEMRTSSQEELEMVVLCSGDKTDEVTDRLDPTKKIVSFSTSEPLSAQQVGFAIGPFERVKLSDLRDALEDENLGQNAVEIYGYCLPGRRKEVKNTCLPTPKAMDFITSKYFACPFRSYAMCFVEDTPRPTSIYAGLTICSTKLLYPEDVIDAAQETTRTLVHAIASQWVGISIVPAEPQDTWITTGIAHFITDIFIRDLCGNNEYRYRMKKQSDLTVELDHGRPSLYELGALLHVDPSEYEFMAIKAPLVLFVLDRRIAKVAGRSKMPAIIAKILTRARIGELANNFLSTDVFQKTVESFFHAKIDDFLNQWVKGSGCPRFQAFQRFNKKKLVVEMIIQQVQAEKAAEKDLEADVFMREVREDLSEIYAMPPQPVFTGPMTIRIHEADGTPYEHIVDIKEAKTSFDIPYNTKYKRLKRIRRQKTKNAGNAGAEGAEGEGDSLLYCLGDVLQSEEEVLNWRLSDWSGDDEDKMSSESYEWIRLDADFEWICRIQLQMPGYMFVSQLQQDRDVVAQLESVTQMNTYPPNPLVSSFLLRTVMDRRYFHGVRTLAARCLAKHASPEFGNIGLFHLSKAFEELFCLGDLDSRIARPNDFSDLPAYYLQCAIVQGISQVRDEKGFAPKVVKEFLLDKLRFNDNSINEFSDAHYISTLMQSLANAVAARPMQQIEHSLDEVEAANEQHATHRLEQDTLAEIDRYRRMDEWTDSYQNLYSRTALECQALLAKANIGTMNLMHFLQYTRPGNYDMLRVIAYKILTQLNVFDKPSILHYILHSMVADSSPWIREKIRIAFGQALATKAIGIGAVAEAVQDDLVVEDPAELESRKTQLARRQTLDGALEALMRELGGNEVLKTHIWNAISFPGINLEDLQHLLDICVLLYKPIDSLVVHLEYPRFWKVDYLGKGKLRFRQTEKVRTKKMPPKRQPLKLNLVPPPLNPPSKTGNSTPSSAGPAFPKIKFKSQGNQSSSATPTPPPPPTVEQIPSSANAPGPMKLKLKFSRPKEPDK